MDKHLLLHDLCPVASDGEADYNARATTPDYVGIFARWARESLVYRRLAKAQGSAQLDFAYGSEESEHLDLFLPKCRPLGTLMYIHGGYWHSLDKSDASLIARPFTEAGYAVAVINYALCPAVTINQIVHQIRCAAVWLYLNAAKWHAPAHRLFACGHSAGGHLAAMLLTTNWASFNPLLPPTTVLGAFCVSGIYDLRPLRNVPSVMEKIAISDELASSISPALLSPNNDTFIVSAVGLEENKGFHDQADIIRENWRANHAKEINCDGRNHFTILDELIHTDGKIFQAAVAKMSS